MELNYLVFPSPKSSYNCETFKGKILWIPKKQDYSNKDKTKYTKKSSLTLIRSCRSSTTITTIQKIPSIDFSFDNKFQNNYKHKSSKTLETHKEHIPCIYIKANNSNIFGLYFHANYEDLGGSYEMYNSISNKLNVILHN